MTFDSVQEMPAPTEAGDELPAGFLRAQVFPVSLSSELPAVVPPRRLPPPGLPGQPVSQPRREYLRPEYAERFRCISSACEDSCCQGWSVPIDHGTYEKYRSNEVMRPHVGRLIVLNTNRPSNSDYARMPLTTNGTCGFLDSEQLCGVQKLLGEEMLSVTCATYPRSVSAHSGQTEKVLNLSCPEAARLTLLDENLLGIGTLRPEDARRYGELRSATDRGGFDSRLAVREFALLLLADRSYPLWQRLYLLGILARRLDTLSGDSPVAEWADAHPGAVAELLNDSARVAAQDRMRPVMEEIAAQTAQQLQLVMELLRLRVAEPPVPPRFLECVQEFERGLKCASATSEEEILAAYSESERLYYRPLMERHPHLLENYLANHVFKNNYPFGRKAEQSAANFGPAADAESEHLSLCVHAALAQTLLIGMAGHHREAFDLAHVVKLVQSLAKTIEHSTQFLDRMKEFVEKRELNNLRGVALLLRQDG